MKIFHLFIKFSLVLLIAIVIAIYYLMYVNRNKKNTEESKNLIDYHNIH